RQAESSPALQAESNVVTYHSRITQGLGALAIRLSAAQGPIDDDNNPPPKKNACLANEPEASAQEAECKNQYPGRYEKCSDLCGYAKCLRPLTACTEEMEDFLSCHMQWGACSCDDNGTSGAFGASEVDDYYYYEGYYYYDGELTLLVAHVRDFNSYNLAKIISDGWEDDGKSDLPDKDDGDGESDESIGVSEQDPISPTPETTTPSTSPMGYGSTTRSKVSELDGELTLYVTHS
ncbi:hypothetical protein THAOC_27730, partial [Thalassiosira oceanica]